MVTPIFHVFDYQQAYEFYIEWLGFHLDWEDRPATGPLYMQVSRGDVVLHLTSHHGDSCPGSKAIAEINGLVAYHYRLVQKTHPFVRPGLEKTSWSEKVMQAEVIDPFGNRLVFVEACA
ncbi:glyoxalase superfamily protein [Hymenobacter sp. B1770]|uniref:glyoxalase superfamily protein n=1 Tax=Hymenobacter sp. B1770 TaxID=1718788 RepID=UPI003CF90576